MKRLILLSVMLLALTGCGMLSNLVTDDMINAKIYRQELQKDVQLAIDYCKNEGTKEGGDWRTLLECIEVREKYQPELAVERAANIVSEIRDKIAERNLKQAIAQRDTLEGIER